MGLMLSISLAYASETKPAEKPTEKNALVKKSDANLIEKPTIEIKSAIEIKKETKKSNKKAQEVTECFILTCGTVCVKVPEPYDPEETIMWYNWWQAVFC